jgi:hypothetical protein
MNLYQHIESFGSYFVSMRKLETYMSIDLAFPSNWGLPKSIQEICSIVPFDSGVENMKGISFVCEMGEIPFEKTITGINKVIRLNKEREMKDELFNLAVQQLKETFAKKDLDTLKTLQFEFGDKPQLLDIIDEPRGENVELAEEGN